MPEERLRLTAQPEVRSFAGELQVRFFGVQGVQDKTDKAVEAFCF